MIDLLESQSVLRARQRDLIDQLRGGTAAADTRRRTRGTARMLRRLQAALARVADGSYGTCMQCGEQISEQRLAEDPSTTLCASCKGEG